jgi:hypothetical protein
MTRYNMNDRPTPGGSMEPRLNSKIVERQLNVKLGPRLPESLVRETTSRGAVPLGSNASRRRSAGLPERFTRD